MKFNYKRTYIIQDAPYEVFVPIKYQFDPKQTHSIHYQLNAHSSIYLKSQLTNIGPRRHR